MTEAGPVLSMCLGFAKEPFTTKSGSCGTELKVLDTETGLSCGYNQPGEICIRGRQIMKGMIQPNIMTIFSHQAHISLHTHNQRSGFNVFNITRTLSRRAKRGSFTSTFHFMCSINIKVSLRRLFHKGDTWSGGMKSLVLADK